MCGRFVIAADSTALQQAFDLASVPELTPRYNVAPTQLAPVIINEDGGRELVMYRWGLVPSWAKDLAMGAKMINARSETIEEKPSFKHAFRRRRCLVPANGFYEWKAEGTKKMPRYIHLKDVPLFAMAGLWETWHDVEKRPIHTFTILTTGANDFMRQFHERMPVIVRPADYGLWLDQQAPTEPLRALLTQYDPNAMTAYEVSTAVNKPVFDGPELIEPLARLL
ncbi:MAG: SOS response-associated peptidase [Pleurocapsa minor GSE-CHR-MK-17-07R]|jgi:putative SOS response-associated peptidase YedK|nr:SOS response-associated peptidase [Pleurocapsa minor GSE-CHR-MK 17-07R]